MAQRLTTEDFIEKARKIHGNKYDYSKVDYVNARSKVCIICPEHGEFWQLSKSHLEGKGCKECGRNTEERGKKINLTSVERIIKAKELYNNFYTYKNTDFSRVGFKTIVTCPIHGDWETTYHMHVSRKCGCRKCYLESLKHNKETFINEYKKRYGNLDYDLTKIEYININTPVTLICPIHGEFTKTAHTLLYCDPYCPQCTFVNSKLEEEIKELLEEYGVDYAPQHKFEWLGSHQSVDFFIPSKNIAIECQGKQHFGEGGWSKDFDFNKQYELDKRKYNLCKENRVKLLYFSNIQPKFEYFDKVFTDKDKLLESI